LERTSQKGAIPLAIPLAATTLLAVTRKQTFYCGTALRREDEAARAALAPVARVQQ